jgi:endonuclease G
VTAATNGKLGDESAENIAPDTHYSNRTGYNPQFLPGHRVDLPALTNKQKLSAARVRSGSGGNPFELKYTHFSIVVNGERKLAYYTAVNIDGATWRKIDRTTGESLAESAEATETWYQDPRIDPDEQSDQSMYSAQKPARVFDRGHLVRREDPNWGTLSRARKANADTFHFTNCTPQQFEFNERAKYWAGIENYILDNAKAENEKVTVITGPVLRDDDPAYRGLQVPMAFWKILVRVENGKLIRPRCWPSNRS